jgi:thiomorpholine-carboxylate dehydrogenase
LREGILMNRLVTLNEDQVRAVLSYEDLIPVIRQALIDYSAGRVIQPVRTVIPVTSHTGWFAIMPTVYDQVMGAKMVTFYPGNAKRGEHTHQAMVQLFRSDTGEPLAIMDGRLITEMRTAAVSAVATDQLAAPEASVLAILGSGVQARSHVAALSRVRAFKEIRIWSRSQSHAQQFATEIGGVVMTAEEAVHGADVVVTVTSSPDPILFGRWLKKNAFVCAVGAVTQDRRELDDEAMQGSLVVESREAAEREPGDILMSGAQITAEIGELLSKAQVEKLRGPIVFKSVGVAVEDIAAAKLVYDKLAL